MIRNAILPTRKVGMNMPEYEYKYNAKKVSYDMQYVKEHYDRIEVKLPKGYRELLKKRADELGINQSTLLKQLIDKELNL